jgi:hypothetical protein
VTPWVLQVASAVIRYRVDSFTQTGRRYLARALRSSPAACESSSVAWGEFLRPTAVAATSPRSLETGERALANQIAIEFSKRAEYMEHDLSAVPLYPVTRSTGPSELRWQSACA